MIHRGAKHSMECAKCSKEVLNVSPRGSNVPQRCQILHGGAEYSTEGVK